MTTSNEENKPNTQPEMQAASLPPKPETPKPTRIFVYDGREFSDPDPKLTPDQIRQYYTAFFPELANAEVLAAVAAEAIIEFKRRVGVKGYDPTDGKAQEIWDGMDKNEKAGVRFGMFPYEKMMAAEKLGYKGKDLAVALMDCAKADGGMRA
jgi:PRTRC genetic system protein C